MRYFIRSVDGPERGPYAWHELKQMLRSQELAGDAQVREERNGSWRALRKLEAERTSARAERDQSEVEDAARAQMRRANTLLATGAAALILGLGATVASLAVGVATGGAAVVFVGLIAAGVVQLGRGIAARP
jgi:Flp pilus assembly protein TadB